MTPLSPSERAAITAAERAGRITRLPSPCAFSGGRFDRLFLGGVELPGGSYKKGDHLPKKDFDQSKWMLRQVERQLARGEIV